MLDMLIHLRRKSLPNAFCIAHRMQNTLESVLVGRKLAAALNEWILAGQRLNQIPVSGQSGIVT